MARFYDAARLQEVFDTVEQVRDLGSPYRRVERKRPKQTAKKGITFGLWKKEVRSGVSAERSPDDPEKSYGL